MAVSIADTTCVYLIVGCDAVLISVRLVQYREQGIAVLARETEVAKQLLKKGDKKRAALTLKKKKYQSQLLDKTEQQLFNIEQLTNSIEFAAVQQKVFDALKTGTGVLQSKRCRTAPTTTTTSDSSPHAIRRDAMRCAIVCGLYRD